VLTYPLGRDMGAGLGQHPCIGSRAAGGGAVAGTTRRWKRLHCVLCDTASLTAWHMHAYAVLAILPPHPCCAALLALRWAINLQSNYKIKRVLLGAMCECANGEPGPVAAAAATATATAAAAATATATAIRAAAPPSW